MLYLYLCLYLFFFHYELHSLTDIVCLIYLSLILFYFICYLFYRGRIVVDESFVADADDKGKNHHKSLDFHRMAVNCL